MNKSSPCIGDSLFIKVDEFGEASQHCLGFNEYDGCQTFEYKSVWQSSGKSGNFGNRHSSYVQIDLPEGKYEIKHTTTDRGVELVRVS